MDLLDDNGEVLARLTDNSIINPGIIADDGHVTASSTSQINLPFQNHNHILENTKKKAKRADSAPISGTVFSGNLPNLIMSTPTMYASFILFSCS